jgi:hypothetical protein
MTVFNQLSGQFQDGRLGSARDARGTANKFTRESRIDGGVLRRWAISSRAEHSFAPLGGVQGLVDEIAARAGSRPWRFQFVVWVTVGNPSCETGSPIKTFFSKKVGMLLGRSFPTITL